jgi:tartrate dehydratase alpha subunit/fumarate hydratase class I-like protein
MEMFHPPEGSRDDYKDANNKTALTMTTTIKQDDLIERCAAPSTSATTIPPLHAHLARAYAASPAAKDAIAQILTNSRMCAEGRRPICQDTGSSACS